LNRSDILDTAKGYVTRDRAATHGDAEDQFTTIGQLWAALLGQPITPAQVALMMACLKVARAWGNPAHDDNWTDLAGYAACGGEIATRPAHVNNLPYEGISFSDHIARRQAGLDALIREAEAAGLHDIAADTPAAPRSAPENGLPAPDLGGVAETATGALQARKTGGEA
jgi:hypothetical protein